MVQRQVLYLGEINDSQKQSWCRSIEVLEEGREIARQVALFPEDRPESPDLEVIQVQISELELHRPRQWGACWLAVVMGAVEAGRVLGRTAAAEPGRDALAECAEDAGGLPADRSRQ